MLNIGLTYQDLRQSVLALQYIQKSLDIACSIGDRSVEGSTLGGLGDVLLASGEYVTANDYFQKALTIAEELGDSLGQIHYLGSIGNLHNARNELPQALSSYTRQLTMARSIGNEPGICNALCNQLSTYRMMENYAQAFGIAQEALQVARKVQSLEEEAFINKQLGLIYEAQGDIHNAIQCFQKAGEYEQLVNHSTGVEDAVYIKKPKGKLNRNPSGNQNRRQNT
jgi:tetratricopeptide (TPR) repeat protein